jgi:hypothetical protein
MYVVAYGNRTQCTGADRFVGTDCYHMFVVKRLGGMYGHRRNVAIRIHVEQWRNDTKSHKRRSRNLRRYRYRRKRLHRNGVDHGFEHGKPVAFGSSVKRSVWCFQRRHYANRFKRNSAVHLHVEQRQQYAKPY